MKRRDYRICAPPQTPIRQRVSRAVQDAVRVACDNPLWGRLHLTVDAVHDVVFKWDDGRW